MEKISIDKDFLFKVLAQVDSLSKRVEYLETLKIKVDYEDFKKMFSQANNELLMDMIKKHPELNLIPLK